MNTIFVSIASYRDPQLLPTLRDLLANSDNPNNITIGIGWQHSPDDTWDTLDEYLDNPNIKILDIPYLQAQGVCWMRSKIQSLYAGEKYYLQLDSHHRFAKGWDTTLIEWHNTLTEKGHSKPLITGYVPGYFPDTDPEGRVNEIWGLNIDRFMPGGAIFLRPHHIDKWEELTGPFPTRFISAHFIFTLGQFATEVPYDEHLYFHGEESSLAARAFTFGYDLFSPHRPIIWHEYTREGKKKHWDDSGDWAQRDEASYERYRKLMGMDPGCSACMRRSIAPGYFGMHRSFLEYEQYAGLKFSTRQIHMETVNYEFPPIKSDYESGLMSQRKYCIDIWKESLKETDYDFFVVAFLDEAGNDIYRQDADKSEIQSLINSDPNDQFIHIWREYNSEQLATTWRVWPHSETKGWCDRIDQKI